MGILKKYLGVKTEDRKMDYRTAGELIESLHTSGAQITRMIVKDRIKTDVKNPSFEQVASTLQTHLAPYQYEFNPNLKGVTEVRHRTRDYASYQMHRFDFTQYIDNLFRKGIKSTTGRLEIKV
jgi:hypothetical protein